MQVFIVLNHIHQGFNPLLHKSEMSRIVSRQEETRFQLVSKPFKFLKSQKSIPRESQEKYKAFILIQYKLKFKLLKFKKG